MLDLRERILELGGTADFEEIIRAAIHAENRNTYTMLPVTITKDSDGKKAMLQPTVKAQVRDADGNLKHVDLPEVEGIVHFMGGGGMTATFPIKQGGEGMVLFASRAIDAWHQSGGSQQAVDTRSHHLSDGIFLPGLRSQPRDLKDINTEAAETRTDDGKHKTSVHPKNGVAVSVEDGKHTMAWHPENGIAASVDGGKHTLNLNPAAGISMKTAMKLAIDATSGIDMKGALGVDGKITSSQPIGAGVLQGILQGGLGAVIGAMMTAALFAASGAGAPRDGIQTVRYALAALWSR